MQPDDSISSAGAQQSLDAAQAAAAQFVARRPIARQAAPPTPVTTTDKVVLQGDFNATGALTSTVLSVEVARDSDGAMTFSVFPLGVDGDIVHYNGGDWALLSLGPEGSVLIVEGGRLTWREPGAEGDVLTMVSGVPQWVAP